MESSDQRSLQGPALTRYETDPVALVGSVLDGRYRITEVLGRGAMGLVLGARHVFLDRPVAVKVLHPTLLLLPETRQRFLREARAASQVAHPGVVSVSDFGVTPDGLHYLVMEYLEGTDLYAYTEAHGAVSAQTAAHIGVQVFDALSSIHAAGWVHRDLKPENLWVVAGSPADAPTIKVIDLGIAAVMDAGRSGDQRARLTKTGHTVGTVHYMSPEQVLAEEVDGRSDVYSMGCILWELVTGECTFEGTSQMAVMMKHMSESAEPPSAHNPTVPAWFDAAVLRCLSKRREQRFATARDAQAAFAAGLAQVPVASQQGGTTSRAAATPSFAETGTASALVIAKRRRWPVIATIATVVAALVVWRVTASNGPPGPDAGIFVTGPAPGKATDPTAAGPSIRPSAESGAASAPTAPPGEAVAPPEADAAGQVAAAPVTLRFDVTPDGATVTVDGRAVGQTPLALEVPPDADEHRYTLSHPGHETRTLTLSHARDQVIRRALPPLPAAPVPATSAARPAPPVRDAPKEKPPAPDAAPTGLMRPALPGGGGP